MNLSSHGRMTDRFSIGIGLIKPDQIMTGHIFLHRVDNGGEYQWEPTKIDWQDIKWCEENNEDFNNVHAPLKLTTDLILMNGFMKDDNGHLWKDLITHYLEFIPAIDGWYPVWAQMPEMSSEDEHRTSMHRILWFHEFQTLMFVLTGRSVSGRVSKIWPSMRPMITIYATFIRFNKKAAVIMGGATGLDFELQEKRISITKGTKYRPVYSGMDYIIFNTELATNILRKYGTTKFDVKRTFDKDSFLAEPVE